MQISFGAIKLSCKDSVQAKKLEQAIRKGCEKIDLTHGVKKDELFITSRLNQYNLEILQKCMKEATNTTIDRTTQAIDVYKSIAKPVVPKVDVRA